MTTHEKNLHAKFNLLLNGYGSVQNGKINISICSTTTKTSPDTEVVSVKNISQSFPELIVFEDYNKN